jgi:hypothetical protein
MTVATEQHSQVKWCTVAFDHKGYITPPRPERNTWVQLLDKLNPFSHHEALLLCQHSETEWVAWVPDHGEAILSVEQFCCPVN